MVMITLEQLRSICPNLRPDKAVEYAPLLNAAMLEFEINTPLRVAAFVAQLCHESGCFRYFEEIWGNTQAQKRYEGRKDLGNTEPGDGYRYRGRGPIQITGRANYLRYGRVLDLPLVDNPDLASLPENGFRIAACYWKLNGLNELADGKVVVDFRLITKRINGGYNGLADRQAFWERAKKAFDVEAIQA